MNISIGGYSFYNTFLEGKMDVFGYLETVKYRYRMDAVDLWNGFFIDRSDSVYKLADKSYIRKIREALDEKEMRVVNFAVDGRNYGILTRIFGRGCMRMRWFIWMPLKSWALKPCGSTPAAVIRDRSR